DTTLQYFAGTIGPQGRRLYVIGRDPFTTHDVQYFRIDLFSPDFVTGVATLHSNSYVRIDDFAYDPLYGSVMGFNSLDQRLVKISGGQVNDFNFLNTSNSKGMGSILFDGSAQLYGYGSGRGGANEGNLFTINKFNGAVEKFDGGPGQAWTDACACPYFVKFEKSISPQQVLPCGEVRIVYRFQNHGGSSFSLESIRDTLSPYLTITNIERPAFSYDSIVGLGSNILQVERPGLYIGNDSLVIWASVDPAATGSYQSHAHLGKLPLMLGGERVSDDPSTASEDDPTLVQFRSEEDLALQLQADVLCYGDTIVLQAPGGGSRYLWSDGSTGDKLIVTQGGTYWLEMENLCGVFRDSLFIDARTEPLHLDLGGEIEVEPGDSVALKATINGSWGPLQYRWQMQPDSYLSCQNCPSPFAQPQQDSKISLTITDEDGCRATDSTIIRLEQIRKLFAPTAFSPNGDNYNDLFYLQGFGEVEIMRLQVFNRWGNLVFLREGGVINDTRHGWDGNSRGRPVAPGVYVWSASLRFPDGAVEQFSGSLSLIR
ncbi:MAG: gliding motility-associated C-terminal domain-containing protein, partial [Bacteroidota bacterium]